MQSIARYVPKVQQGIEQRAPAREAMKDWVCSGLIPAHGVLLKFLRFVLAVVLCWGLTLVGLRSLRHHRTVQLTPERAATHSIRYFDHGKIDGECTGTAIGPHALLTAGHCNEDGSDVFIQLDYSFRYYRILAIVTDGRDHDIYILDGPAFKNIVKVHTREARVGEPVVCYGTGNSDFPPHTYVGRETSDNNGRDQSDVSAHDRTHQFSIDAIPGDSGAAIYGADGSIVALVSWQRDNEEITGIGSALNFGQDTYRQLLKLTETTNNGDDTSPTADSK